MEPELSCAPRLQAAGERDPFLNCSLRSPCAVTASVIGCVSINPDGGSYPHWEAEVQQMLQRWRPVFEHGGMALSLQRTRCRCSRLGPRQR